MINEQRKSVILGGEFPLYCRRCDHHGDREAHCHDFNELVIITAGHAIHFVEERQYPVRTGDVFLILPGQKHGYLQAHKFGLINLLWHPYRLNLPLYDLVASPGYRLLFNTTPMERAAAGAREVLHVDRQALNHLSTICEHVDFAIRDTLPGHTFRAVTHFMELLAFLADYFSPVHAHLDTPPTPYRLVQLTDYLQNHLADHITLPDMMHRMAMSRSKLYRLFQQGIGCSPTQYLTRLRIDHAKTLLLNTSRPVTDIASECGFPDANYFTRVFHTLTHRSPRDFRLHKD